MDNVIVTLESDKCATFLESGLGAFPVVLESREGAAADEIEIGKAGSFKALADDSQVIQVEFFLDHLHKVHAHVARFDSKKLDIGHCDCKRENRATGACTHISPFEVVRCEVAPCSRFEGWAFAQCYKWHERVGNVSRQELSGILGRNQIPEFLSINNQVCKLVKLVESLFGQLHTMFCQELVQEIFLFSVFSITQFSFAVIPSPVRGRIQLSSLYWDFNELFHVKPYEASEAETNIFVSISEPIKVAIVGQSPTCDSESRQTFFVRIEI